MKTLILDKNNYNEKEKNLILEAFLEFSYIRIKETNNKDLWKKVIIEKFNNYMKKNLDNLKIIYIKNDHNEVIGFLFWLKKTEEVIYFENKDYLYINYLYIKEKEQWKWLSSKLKDLIINEARKMWLKELRLHVADNNKKAQSIYKKWWFDDYYHLLKKEL